MEAPKEISKSLEVFKSSLHDVEETFESLFSVSLADIHRKMDVLDKAKLQLVSAYAINSLFWMYLCTQGVDPRQHPIKQELRRIQEYMGKVKEITDKKKAAKLDKDAAKRFVRNALWENEEEAKSSPAKRKAEDSPGPSKKSR
ncbi:nuclear nucleic acid-binding protein C1D-like [Diadema antillarum]|uniref:nuclear nucleic acid-binding protein C1D-like n=1 Tax=Diadema antillarum TaxID=105358 RepID=UPI003A897CB8